MSYKGSGVAAREQESIDGLTAADFENITFEKSCNSTCNKCPKDIYSAMWESLQDLIASPVLATEYTD